MLFQRYGSDALHEWIEDHGKEAWEAGPGADFSFAIPCIAMERFLEGPDGSLHELAEIRLAVGVRYELHIADPSYYTYGHIRVATGEVTPSEDNPRYRLTMVLGGDGRPQALNVRAKGEEQ